MNCDKCDISKTCVPCLMGTGRKSAKIMFVADNPTDFESDDGLWMNGKAGNLFRDLLSQIGLDVDKDCYFTGAIKCPTPSDDKGVQRQPSRDEIANCNPYLEAEIKIVNPEIIVPMGNVALKKIMNKTGITKFRGKAIKQDDRIIFPMVHPTTIFRQPVHAKNFTTDLGNLGKLIKEGDAFLEKKEVDYRYLETLDEALAEIERLNTEADSDIIVFDLETTGLDPFRDDSKIVCISLTDKTHYGVTIPLEHRQFEWTGDQLNELVAGIRNLMENPKVKKMGHNGKFDTKWLKAIYNIDTQGYAFDPMVAHYITVSEERGGHGLKELAWELTDMGGYDNALDDYKKENGIVGNYDMIDWEILREYAAADVDCTMRLYEVFNPKIDEHEKWPSLFELYMESSEALRDLEVNGIKLDRERAEEFQGLYLKKIAQIEDKLRMFPEIVQIEREKQDMFERRKLEMKKPKEDRDPEILKWDKFKNFKFSFSSPNQLRELLFEKLGLDTPFLTDKGKLKSKNQLTIQDYSTGKETLAYLEDKHPIANLMSEWRKLEKVYGTYIAPAVEWIGNDGLVHPSFNLTGTVTSRLSSEKPNAQNFPRKTNDPREFSYHYGPKKLFISRFGADGVIVQFDYSQLELRVAAIFSGDPNLIQAYKDGKDIHRYVASKVHGIPESEVTDDQRTAAKAVGFGLLYGKGARSLAQDMGVSLEEAEDFIAKYFEEFQGVRNWINGTKKQVKEQKYVETLAGFRRRLPGVDSNDRGIQADSFRQGVNSPIQGTGSSMTLKSIVMINKMFRKFNLKSCLAITVHDSIVADVYVPELKKVYKIMKHVMEHLPFDWITVPIVSDAEVGRDYGSLVGIDDIEEVLAEGVFEYIDRKVAEKKKKDYEKAGIPLLATE